ncbi:MAG: hypothetical protein ACFFE8_00275 [Candidatus Heimdallarchaeota archaeon]
MSKIVAFLLNITGCESTPNYNGLNSGGQDTTDPFIDRYSRFFDGYWNLDKESPQL